MSDPKHERYLSELNSYYQRFTRREVTAGQLGAALRFAVEAGWTKAGLGKELKISRERVRQLIEKSSEDSKNPLKLKPPIIEAKPKPSPVQQVLPTEEELRTLHTLGSIPPINGSAAPNAPARLAALEFSALVEEMMSRGVKPAVIAAASGKSWNTIRSMMARHGRKKADGTPYSLPPTARPYEGLTAKKKDKQKKAPAKG